MSATTRITAVLACHNRKPLTLKCLENYFAQMVDDTVALEAVVLDDGSSDGTSEAIAARFPRVRLLHGDGSLFWNGGMHRAFGEATATGSEYYLWLNDDTQLYPDTLGRFMKTVRQLEVAGYERNMIVGSVQDPASGALTYGGSVRSSTWHPLKFELVAPADHPLPCVIMHGNCVLIPDDVARLVGNLDRGFSHAIGDIDYSLRATEKGVSVWIAPGYAGTCATNPIDGSWLDTRLSLRERWRQVTGPKGLPPREWMYFARKYAGMMWPIYGSLPYVRMTLSAVTARFGHQKLRPIA
ncbi:MAG: glycosyltransferase family 2 protein [Rhodothermales bacterium]|nr:glycosyltransferase family 2 protein [Rhodothermales bacterium]